MGCPALAEAARQQDPYDHAPRRGRRGDRQTRPRAPNPASDGTQAGVTADLSSIAIKPVEQRYAQQVRNNLIFLFNRGAGQPAAAAYTMTLVVTAIHESAAVVQIGDDKLLVQGQGQGGRS